MADRQFAISGKWALAADRLQWMVQRQYLHRGEIKWQSVSFVSSTKDILARCMREKGCPPADAVRLLAGLPSTFGEWTRKRAQTCGETVSVDGQAPQAALHTLQTHSARSYCGAQVVTIQPRSHAADHPGSSWPWR